MKNILTLLLPAAFLFISCGSSELAVSAVPESNTLKNWDMVARTLDKYNGKSFDYVSGVFGENYIQEGDNFVFYSPTEESWVIFLIKNDKVRKNSYGGSYADIQTYLDSVEEFKNSELEIAANAWLGFSSDLLKETFGNLVLKTSDKSIFVGPSESTFIEFDIASYSPSSSAGKPYIKKTCVKGSYEELKDYLIKVPAGSIPVRKIKQKN